MTAAHRFCFFVFISLIAFHCGDSGQTTAWDADLPDPDPLPLDPEFDNNFNGYGPEATVTTAVQVLRPRYDPDETFVDRWGQFKVPPEEIGRDYPQPGEAHVARDDLHAGGTADATDRKSILYFVALSDAQLIDSESPAYVPSNKGSNVGLELPAFHLAAPLFPHILDAQIQTALMFSRERAFDFFIHTGDAVENAQGNELSWFVTIMTGGIVDPDSGEDIDLNVGPGNDPKDPFLAAGVPAGIPWYAVIGNHDLMVNGNFPPLLVEAVHQPQYLDRVQETLSGFGLTLPGVSTDAYAPSVLPVELDVPLNASEENFDPHLVPTLEELMALQGAEIVADPARATMTSCDFVEAHFDGGTPDGHGFGATNRSTCNGWYVADPVAGLPIRLIVLDTGPHIGGVKGSITPPLAAGGLVDQGRLGDPQHDQWAFLIQELDRAVVDEVAVIIASHHSTSDIILGNSLGAVGALLFPEDVDVQQMWEQHLVEPAESHGGAELRELLTAYPNVVLHVVGHTHRNRVTAICPDGTPVRTEAAQQQGVTCPAPPSGRSPANGYWEVMAASTAKYPHQFRILEVVDNRDGTGSIYATSVNPQAGARSLSLFGRILGLADEQLSGDDSHGGSGLLWDRNVELRIQWPAEVASRLDALSAPFRVESLTTLYDPQPGLPELPAWP